MLSAAPHGLTAACSASSTEATISHALTLGSERNETHGARQTPTAVFPGGCAPHVGLMGRARLGLGEAAAASLTAGPSPH